MPVTGKEGRLVCALVPQSRSNSPPRPAVRLLVRPSSWWVFSALGTAAISSRSHRASILLSCCVCCCLSEIEAKYDKKVRMLRDELDLRRKTEIHEVEERKNSQISMLMQRHEEAFTDIRNYYSEITLNNLALINSLKVLLECPAPLGRHSCL